ncbi:dolichyl-phosphate beta-glucosyltransferase [Tribolium castaneum]|uniref:Dolichyl-phosphate beta-glucosyltransferase n=1 Tax=Tribolium castaneum TaxID=7070 RepID=D2A2D5_TRICA|nr:PREDICTED: dolichyl-phosphate beta-glucosyltransferase [Tribolium castaneum]EFA02177.1 Dolichyl-phosphate beta-glucosyltransferase-like Protein [Tribolium castaneum]|eukprot:XP_008191718.1 PREDICTED: dolichyl-phosphate beta-glucosyltransferase [Tribolium castaneum]
MDLPFKLLFFYFSAICASVFLAFCILLIVTTSQYPVIVRSKKEKEFLDPVTGNTILFPTLDDKPCKKLSVIVPAYNEENRLPPMLEECVDFLESRCKQSNFTYEIIIVSDGSTDGTLKVANEWCKKLGVDKLRVLALETNRGKGGAVRLGMQSARGAVLLFADADGATKFSDLTKLEKCLCDKTGVDYLKNHEDLTGKMAIIVGSRAHLEKESVAKRSFFRTILMYGFHFLVWLFTVKGVKDTQCGFKLFTRDAARLCFDSIHVERWAFDVELLYIAQKLHIPIGEVAVNWTEIEGSKLTPFWSSVQMGKDLGLIWLRYMIGAWKIKQCTKKD